MASGGPSRRWRSPIDRSPVGGSAAAYGARPLPAHPRRMARPVRSRSTRSRERGRRRRPGGRRLVEGHVDVHRTASGGSASRLGRLEIRLGPARVWYRETATPETDPPSTSHRPVRVPGRPRPPFSPAGDASAMPALSVVSVGGDADHTDFPCSRSPSPAWFPAPGRRRSPSAARGITGIRPSAFRGPAVLHRVAGLMAPASPSQLRRSGAWDLGALGGHSRPSCWPCQPDPEPVPSPDRHSDTKCRKPGRCRSATDTAPACLLDLAATYNTVLTAPRSTSRFSSCAADRAEFAPAPDRRGSGGRSQRSLP